MKVGKCITMAESGNSENEGLKRAGVLPAQQLRSRALRDRLIAEGMRLARARPFHDVAIADLCAAANCSTGAFYARFPDKLTLLKAVMVSAAAESRPLFEAIVNGSPFDQIIRDLVAAQVARFQAYETFYRSAFKVSLDDGAAWTPFRQNASGLADCYISRLRSEPSIDGVSIDEDKVRFAFQIMYAMLNNTILNRPGPFHLPDPEFATLLEASMIAAMGIHFPAEPKD